jgi:hypothetical protein
VGLLNTDARASVRALLTETALRQFHENEHRLLIVHRSAQLMDDTEGWTWAEPIFRPAVQYLATRPDVAELSGDTPPETRASDVSAARLESVVEGLVEADYGDEPRILLEATGLPPTEVIALTTAEMLRRSRFDAHAVTGVHCILDLLHDAATPPGMRALAIETALRGQRTRRQKERRASCGPSERRRHGPVVSMPYAMSSRTTRTGLPRWKRWAAPCWRGPTRPR